MMSRKKHTAEISILSWNIHDSMDSNEGPKNDDREFIEQLTASKIFCLQETKESFSLPDYKCFNSLRKDSRSGGLCIGVHRSMEDCIKTVEIDSPDIQALTLRLDIGNESKNLSIINVYDSPEHGSYKKRKKQGTPDFVTTIDSLMDVMAANKDLGEIYLTGDFNARTGSENHEITEIDDEELLNQVNNDLSHPSASI